jgi:hypothetical protein
MNKELIMRVATQAILRPTTPVISPYWSSCFPMAMGSISSFWSGAYQLAYEAAVVQEREDRRRRRLSWGPNLN